MAVRNLLGWLGLVLIAAGCASVRPSDDSRCGVLPDETFLAITGTSDEAFNEVTRRIVEEKCDPRAAWLSDTRLLRVGDVTVDAPEHFYHLGVNTVSDYLLCLLQFRERIDSRSILEQCCPGALSDCKDQYECDACNAAIYPLPPEIRAHLVEYWRKQLAQR
jgi:hypothetical protein